MKIIVAKTAGFCMGVRRAVDLVLEASKRYEGPIYTLGPLIHNPQVMEVLKEKGISRIDAIPERGSGAVLIRAHGVPPETAEQLKAAGFKVIDATCPRVIKVQTIIKKHAGRGYATIIVGDRDHPEVIGLLGYAGKDNAVIANMEQFLELPDHEKAIIVAQTTQDTALYDCIKEHAKKKYPHYKVFNTICDSTQKRQNEVKRLAQDVDAVVVVGGFTSGNTQRLYEIAKKSGKSALHVETEQQIDRLSLSGMKSFGITAGASTPNWVIRRVYRFLETVPFLTGNSWRRRLFSIQKTLLFTSIYLALGAGCLTYACVKLQNIGSFFPHGLIPILYVQSMHIFNNLTGRRADRYNDPDKSLFYDEKRKSLMALALISGLTGLVISVYSGTATFLLYAAMSISGVLYNIRLIPKNFLGIKSGRIKDIPASKTILIAVAWGIAAAFMAPISELGTLTPASAVAFFWSAGLVFVRTAFFDIMDMHGDRIVGRETLPIVVGEKRTLILLKITLTAISILIFGASAWPVVNSLGYALALCPVFLFLVIVLHERGQLISGIRLEFLVESQLVLAGIIAAVYSLI